jgi:hypothetical protein
MENVLKPCKHCGKTPELITITTKSERYNKHQIKCCHLTLHQKSIRYPEKVISSLTDEWNAIQTIATQQQAIDILEKIKERKYQDAWGFLYHDVSKVLNQLKDKE